MANHKSKHSSAEFNEQHEHYNKKHDLFIRHVITILVLVTITFVAGLYFSGSGIFSPFGGGGGESSRSLSQESKVGTYEEGYQVALDYARKRLSDEGFAEYEEVINKLFVTIKSINGQNIVVEFKASTLDILMEGMTDKTVAISGNTTIEQRIDKTAEQIEKEYEEYDIAKEEFEASMEVNPETDSEGPEAPLHYDIKNIQVSELKVGDKLLVRTDVNIRTNDSFEATQIELRHRPELVEERVSGSAKVVPTDLPDMSQFEELADIPPPPPVEGAIELSNPPTAEELAELLASPTDEGLAE